MLFGGFGAPAPEAAVATAPPAAAERPAALAVYAATEQTLDRIREEVRGEIERRGAGLPSDVRTLLDENLATIERAIAEIEAALAREPDNQELARTYIDYRQRQIDLLRRVNRAASRV
jgi:hypothetical protein